MSNITVVCCWNNEKVYGDFVETLKSQSIPCEIIGIDNRSNKGFKSCAAAYNSVIGQVKTKYVLYSHQDILLHDREALARFVSYLERTGKDDILGAAGVRFDSPEGFSNVTHIHNKTGELVHGTASFPEGGMTRLTRKCAAIGICMRWRSVYGRRHCLAEKRGAVMCLCFIYLLGRLARHFCMGFTKYAGSTLNISRLFGRHVLRRGRILYIYSRFLATSGVVLYCG